VGRTDLAEGWDPKNTKTPSEVTSRSLYPTWWVCNRISEHPPWQVAVANRTLKGTGCPACKHANRFKPRIFGLATFGAKMQDSVK